MPTFGLKILKASRAKSARLVEEIPSIDSACARVFSPKSPNQIPEIMGERIGAGKRKTVLLLSIKRRIM